MESMIIGYTGIGFMTILIVSLHLLILKQIQKCLCYASIGQSLMFLIQKT